MSSFSFSFSFFSFFLPRILDKFKQGNLVSLPIHHVSRYRGLVWYVCLKTENCCLKIFVEVRVGEKVC